MRGLVAYDEDSQSDTEIVPPSSVQLFTNDKSSKNGPKTTSDGRSKIPQVVIKKPSTLRTHQPRAHVGQELESEASTSQQGISTLDLNSEANNPPARATPAPRSHQDELLSVRESLKPPPIPGVEDWGIPPEPNEPVDPALEKKFKTFAEWKTNPSRPAHFNDVLMSNRTYRNPHFYTTLVNFANVDERSTNFPRELWDPNDLKSEWFADQIAEAQKERSERQSSSQGSGKRNRIDFTSSSRPANASSGGGAKGKDVFGTQHNYSHGQGPAPKRSRLQIPAGGIGGSINSGYVHPGSGNLGSARPSRWGPA